MSDDMKFLGAPRDDLPDDLSTPADAIDAMYENVSDEMLDDSDLGLITDYLANELPRERVAEVRRRLEHDQTFRELAAPLVLAWSIPPRWQREPIPHEEIERSWEEFTRRANLVQQRRKAFERRLRIIAMVVMLGTAVAFGAWLSRDNGSQEPRKRDLLPRERFATVHQLVLVTDRPDSDGWLTIRKVRIKLEPGARLMRAAAPITNPDVKPGLVLHLEGTARFVHLPPPEASPFADSTRLTVLTGAGVILSPRADFRVYARADTADVEVFRRQVPPTPPPKTAVDSLLVPLPDQVVIGGMGEQIGVVLLAAGELGRLQPGSKPLKLRAAPDNPYNNNPLTKILQKILP